MSIKIPNYTTPGQRLAAARESKHMTKTELANAIGTTYRRILEWEKDEKFPSRYIDAISTVLGVHPEWLKTGSLEYSPAFYQQSYWLENHPLSEEELAEKRTHIENIQFVSSAVSLDTLRIIGLVSDAAYYHDLKNQIGQDRVLQVLDVSTVSADRVQEAIALLKEYYSYMKQVTENTDKTVNSQNEE